MSELAPETSVKPYQGQLLLQEPLASYTTWRVGGLAKQLYKPLNKEDLSNFLRQLPKSEKVIFLGLGSNSLIRDGGFSGTIVLTQGCLMDMKLIDPQTIRVEGGVSCATMARFCARNNLVGAEFLAGIPGTLGGALRMNAGCSGSETWKWVQSVETISRQGELQIRDPNTFSIAYRQVLGLEDDYFIAGTFRFENGDKEAALQLIKQLLAHRAMTQPTNEYNCGSVFRNPPGDFAARLIEACGLKGYMCGHAMVSEKHANFIINKDGLAKAEDIESLITLVQDTVFTKTQIQLIREVHIIGDK